MAITSHLILIWLSLCKSSKQSTRLGYLTLLIHGYTISVPVLILAVFRQLLLRNGKISSKSLFWNERTQRADSRKVTSQAPQVTLVLYILKLVLYFNLNIISNQIKYYLAINRRNFLQIQYGFYRHALQIQYQLGWLVIERTCTKNSRKLMSGVWPFGASWWKVTKALSLYEIFPVSLCFLLEQLWQGLVFN